MNSIRFRVLVITFLMIAGIYGTIAYLFVDIYKSNKALQISECRSTVDFTVERINKKIRELREAAKSMALCGYMYYNSAEHSSALAETGVKTHFEDGAVAVGGGIWFEPYSVHPDKKRDCYYAYNDGQNVLIDTGFLSDEYDYHTQIWYTTIMSQVTTMGEVAWSPPYFDGEGTKSLMITGGAGIYDRNMKFVGVSTVDWKLDAISLVIAQIRPTPNSFSLFADRKNDYIIALNDKSVEQDTVGKSLKILEWLTDGDERESTFTYHGTKYLSFRYPLDNGMTIIVNVPEDELFAGLDSLARKSLVTFLILGAVFALAVYFVFHYFITGPIAYLSKKAAEIGGGNFDTAISLPRNDEFGRLAAVFGTMVRDIKAYIQNLQHLTEENRLIARELSAAKQMKDAMLASAHKIFPTSDKFALQAATLPAKEPGGDFVDYFQPDARHLVVVSADLSGKGFPASIFALVLQNFIRNFAQQSLDVSEILEYVNERLAANHTEMSASVFLGVLDLETGDFSYANAGHAAPFIAQDGTFAPLAVSDGEPLGLSKAGTYQKDAVKLKKDARVLLYTNGVLRLFAEGDDAATQNRIFKILEQEGNFAYQIRCAISDACKGERQDYEIALLGVAYTGSARAN